MDSDRYDAIVVGAGFGGIHMLHELQKLDMSACGLEAGSDVGGAWYWNRYPGARCDVESLLYCFSFSRDLDDAWQWSERYPAQAEIQRYIAFAADRFDVRKLIRFDRFVSAALYDDDRNLWSVTLNTGEHLEARFVIMATGPLTAVVWPDLAGIDDFKGERYHTARWPDSVALAGKRIGVIGNGSSGTQFMTEAAKSAGELHAFIRTPQFSVPAFNVPLSQEDRSRWGDRRDQIRTEVHQGLISGAGDTFADRSILFNAKPGREYSPEEQNQRLEKYWNFGGAQLARAFTDTMVSEETNAIVADFARAKIRAVITDPAKAKRLMPTFAFGGKRLIVDTGFYQIFNQTNVHVHDIRANSVVRIASNGVETTDSFVELDMLVFATGFDAVSGALDLIDIRGRNGLRLRDHWADGPKAYLGIAMSQFPNLFTINGPGAPGPFSNVVISNEWIVEEIVSLLKHMQAEGFATVEASPESENDWMELVASTAAPTFFAKTENWYTGANVAGKKRGIANYINLSGFRRKLLEEAEGHFPSLRFDLAPDAG